MLSRVHLTLISVSKEDACVRKFDADLFVIDLLLLLHLVGVLHTTSSNAPLVRTIHVVSRYEISSKEQLTYITTSWVASLFCGKTRMSSLNIGPPPLLISLVYNVNEYSATHNEKAEVY